jgi:murein DD-endopeptidase MepM/ murein hydrolase activator NlpD
MATFNQVYLGYVKHNDDAFKMGRLKVWVPELSSDENDESQWFTVQYCSPMAGATSVRDNVKEGKNLTDTQRSYGWWSVVPDLENEIVVMFLNGDPNRGIYIGGLYQQFMNHMVPGIPSNSSYQEGNEGQDPPVAEYNRWDPNVSNSDNHTRARYDPLHEALVNQGLYSDPQRGPSTAGARRAGVSKVYGFLSPSGSQFVFDDSEENSYIRIRTATGAQVLINDSAGYVYVNSGNGNSWLEVSDDGVDVYSAKPISLRSQGDFNIHSDASINMYAKKSINLFSSGSGTMQFGKSLDTIVGSTMNTKVTGDINLVGSGALNQKITGDFGLKVNGKGALEVKGTLGMGASGDIIMKAPQIQQNAATPDKPGKTADAKGPELSGVEDRELNAGSNYEEISTNSIVSRLPTHEPWSGHPSGKSEAARARVDLNVSSRSQVDGNGSSSSDSGDIQPGEEEIIPTDNATFVAPATGPITSLYGPRGNRIHKGVDIGIPIGTNVVAMRDGTVTKAGRGTGYGNVIYIKHDDGYETRYAHLNSFNVRAGTKVKQGQVIAKSGNTGVGTGPHLHFEIRKGGQALNPNSKLKNIRKGVRLTAGKN